LTQLGLATYTRYVTDEHISPQFTRALGVAGFRTMTVVEALGRRGADDSEIIDWLSLHGKKDAIWVTKDWSAQKRHAKLIHEKGISVLWIEIPGQGLQALRELQLLVSITEYVMKTVSSSSSPLYFRASHDGVKPKLRRIVSPLTDSNLIYEKTRYRPT